MTLLAMTLLLGAFFMTLLGCIPYGIWMLYTAWKRRWRMLIFQFAIPMVVGLALALFLGVTYLCYVADLYDTTTVISGPLFEHDSRGGFHGDGYSMEIYPLPTALRKRFESADERLMTQYPKLPSHLFERKRVTWHEAPLDARFEKYLSFALNHGNNDGDDALPEYFAHIREALSRKRTYYAFFYYESEVSLSNVEFFIVDLIGGHLYVINHDT